MAQAALGHSASFGWAPGNGFPLLLRTKIDHGAGYGPALTGTSPPHLSSLLEACASGSSPTSGRQLAGSTPPRQPERPGHGPVLNVSPGQRTGPTRTVDPWVLSSSLTPEPARPPVYVFSTSAWGSAFRDLLPGFPTPSCRSRRPRHSPDVTSAEVVGTIIYLRQNHHFGSDKIVMCLLRCHDIQI